MSQENQRESVKVLQECVDLQVRKSKDYQSDVSNVKQADHYRRGIDTIHDMVHQKLLRAESLLAKIKAGVDVEFESLEDTYKDAINYLSFGVSYVRKKMEGQHVARDIFNQPIQTPTITGTATGPAISAPVRASFGSAGEVPYTVKAIGVGAIEASNTVIQNNFTTVSTASITDTSSNLNGLADATRSDK